MQVFSTHVEMFPSHLLMLNVCKRFLHARGDVSDEEEPDVKVKTFSPRTWRCFRRHSGRIWSCRVFSTHVEMFPQKATKLLKNSRFLHARGDVSSDQKVYSGEDMFSPRTWRCFFLSCTHSGRRLVFSTHVESYIRDTKIGLHFIGN